MEHLGTKTLESDRILLRRFKIEDAQAMYDNWANDPEVTKYLGKRIGTIRAFAMLFITLF